MRDGAMAVVSLAVVANHPATHVEDNRIRPYRDPAPGELYAYIGEAFTRLQSLLRSQELGIVTDRQSLAAATAAHPSVLVNSEGGDFLEGSAARVDEAYERWDLRQPQLPPSRDDRKADV